MRFLPSIFLIISLACSTTPSSHEATLRNGDSLSLPTPDTLIDHSAIDTLGLRALLPDTTELERTLLRQGLVNMLQIDSSIQFDIKYSTEDNFMAEDAYGDFDQCYLQPEIAAKLAHAQQLIQNQDARLSLLVFDCVRPRSVQRVMWDIVSGTEQEAYVAPPGKGGSMHNYGAAVDLGLIHLDTGIVDMGTHFDYFGRLAQPRHEVGFVKTGELSSAHLANRRLLRAAMLEAGFHGILSEWWHFNGYPRAEVRKRYRMVE